MDATLPSVLGSSSQSQAHNESAVVPISRGSRVSTDRSRVILNVTELGKKEVEGRSMKNYLRTRQAVALLVVT